MGASGFTLKTPAVGGFVPAKLTFCRSWVSHPKRQGPTAYLTFHSSRNRRPPARFLPLQGSRPPHQDLGLITSDCPEVGPFKKRHIPLLGKHAHWEWVPGHWMVTCQLPKSRQARLAPRGCTVVSWRSNVCSRRIRPAAKSSGFRTTLSILEHAKLIRGLVSVIISIAMISSSCARTGMRNLSTIACAFVVLAAPSAYAKRVPAPKVPPLIYQGIRYVAPNDNGRRGYIQAWDANTNLLWSVTLFRNFIIPLLEVDVQWVYIKSLRVVDGKLIARDERGRTFSVDPKTRAVKRLPKPKPKPFQAAAHQARQPILGQLTGAPALNASWKRTMPCGVRPWRDREKKTSCGTPSSTSPGRLLNPNLV